MSARPSLNAKRSEYGAPPASAASRSSPIRSCVIALELVHQHLADRLAVGLAARVLGVDPVLVQVYARPLAAPAPRVPCEGRVCAPVQPRRDVHPGPADPTAERLVDLAHRVEDARVRHGGASLVERRVRIDAGALQQAVEVQVELGVLGRREVVGLRVYDACLFDALGRRARRGVPPRLGNVAQRPVGGDRHQHRGGRADGGDLPPSGGQAASSRPLLSHRLGRPRTPPHRGAARPRRSRGCSPSSPRAPRSARSLSRPRG